MELVMLWEWIFLINFLKKIFIICMVDLDESLNFDNDVNFEYEK